MKKNKLISLLMVSIVSLSIMTGTLVFASASNSKSINTKANTNTNTNTNNKTSTNTKTNTNTNNKTSTKTNTKPIVLGFAGDVNFDELNPPAKKYDSAKKGVLGIISKDLVNEMKSADLMMLNNEFSYSTRGTKTPKKTYTFRANPKRVNVLKDMGVDIVSLANNHTLDYGQTALKDTFSTLDKAGIKYVGAGKNMDRAKAPVYYTIGNKKIAFLAASRVVYAGNWYATNKQPGMVGTYDPSIIIKSIKAAKAKSNYVVIFVHWGVERKNYPETYQRVLAKKYIDAGADAVVGCHPHVMQGFEYYKGKPIAYSLGNYVFSRTTNKSGLLKLYLDPNGKVRMQLRPAMYKNIYTYMIKDAKAKTDYFNYMKKISYHVKIDKNGYITSAK